MLFASNIILWKTILSNVSSSNGCQMVINCYLLSNLIPNQSGKGLVEFESPQKDKCFMQADESWSYLATCDSGAS